MNIQEFSEIPDLMDKFIKKPPEWLEKMGDEQKQKEYLRERVLIHIFQRFEFKRHDKFDGYLLRLTD